MASKNAFYAQSAGVTAVINASACGVLQTARQHSDSQAQMAIDIGRREFLAGLWGTAVTWPVVAQAQQLRGTTPRIGVLWHASNEQEEAIYLGAFRQGLRDVGYVEGQTIILEDRFAGEQYDRFDALATTQQKVA
jgi:hypothetical protein